jgi:diguanylate cyclase (GGDEF)-like protein
VTTTGQDRRFGERALAGLFFMAGLVGVLNVVVLRDTGFDLAGLLVVSAAGLALPAALVRSGGRTAPIVLHGLLALGSAAVTAAIHFTGGTPNAAAMLYVWVAIYVAYFFTAPAIAAHLTLVAGLYAGVIALQPPGPSALGNYVTAMLTLVVAATCVFVLRRRLHTSMDAASRLARTDQLTGVANRRGWDELGEATSDELTGGAQTSVAVIDLDGFKAYNDRHGHAAGDALLAACTRAWRTVVRPGDQLARLGGDEFAVLLVDCDGVEAVALAARLRAVTPAPVTCSVGLAAWAQGEPLHHAVERADAELYRAKAARLALTAA